MHYRRTSIEIESPEQLGYSVIKNNLAESSFSDMRLADYDIEADVGQLLLPYADHHGSERLRMLITDGSHDLRADDVLVTAGAAAALFIIASALARMSRGSNFGLTMVGGLTPRPSRIDFGPILA